MFKWLKKLLYGKDSNIHVWLHIDGKLRLDNEYRSSDTKVVVQGPIDGNVAAEASVRDNRAIKSFEESVEAGLFTDTQATEASFGTEIELPPKEGKDKDNKVS
jgi:hypothetical protein